MAKKGETTKKSKPKPRLAVYVGGGITAGLATGIIPGAVPNNLWREAKVKNLGYGVSNDAAALATSGPLIKAATPLGIGVLATVVADKLGVNRALAKARMPFRV